MRESFQKIGETSKGEKNAQSLELQALQFSAIVKGFQCANDWLFPVEAQGGAVHRKTTQLG